MNEGELEDRSESGQRQLPPAADIAPRMPIACACGLSDTALGLPGLTRMPITLEAGNKPCSNCNCLATNVLARKLTPVTLPPGRFMLTTRPNFTGSAPIANTMGMLRGRGLGGERGAGRAARGDHRDPPGD